MGKRTSDDVLANAEQLVRVWLANPKLSLGDLTRQQFEALVATFKVTRSTIEDLRTQLTASLNEGGAQEDQIHSITVRARSAAKGQFGADSTQYEQLGGTRTSDRKPPKRKGSGGSGGADDSKT